jgi:hypothetical protein
MRKRLVLAALTLGAVLALGNCKDDVGLTSVPTEVETFTAALNAAQEVPTNASTATGTATLLTVGGVLVYSVSVSNLSNAFVAHIHGPAPAGQNASVILNLCGTGTPAPSCGTGTNFSGILAFGLATPIPPVSVDSLLVLLRSGQAYVNVHTTDGVAPGGTGPGDFPGGEIRGQIAKQ